MPARAPDAALRAPTAANGPPALGKPQSSPFTTPRTSAADRQREVRSSRPGRARGGGPGRGSRPGAAAGRRGDADRDVDQEDQPPAGGRHSRPPSEGPMPAAAAIAEERDGVRAALGAGTRPAPGASDAGTISAAPTAWRHRKQMRRSALGDRTEERCAVKISRPRTKTRGARAGRPACRRPRGTPRRRCCRRSGPRTASRSGSRPGTSAPCRGTRCSRSSRRRMQCGAERRDSEHHVAARPALPDGRHQAATWRPRPGRRTEGLVHRYSQAEGRRCTCLTWWSHALTMRPSSMSRCGIAISAPTATCSQGGRLGADPHEGRDEGEDVRPQVLSERAASARD